jgi:hypothetical protein
MAYGSDITQAIPVPLSNPAGSTNYSATGVAYDVAIAGQPFFINANDDTPYRRVTAQYRKQQIDQTREPGEQTLTGWWLRSQSSFHNGQGIKYFEPINDESLRFQYTKSKGCDVWTKGQVTLLSDVDAVHTVTGEILANGRPDQIARSIQWTTDGITYDGILLWDEYDVDKVFPTITVSINNKARTTNVATLTTTAAHGLCTGMEITITGVDATFNGTYTITSVPTTTTFRYTTATSGTIASTAVSPVGTGVAEVIHFVDYNSGTDDKVYAICDDGVYAYWVTNKSGTGKLQVNKRPLDSSTAASEMFTSPGIIVTNAVIEYTKERIIMAVNDSIYEFATDASSMPTAVYSHSDPDHLFTSIASSGVAIYLSGYSGIQSNIYKFTLNTSTGSMPSLTSAITAAELPAGEVTHKIFYYLGYMLIGTSEGVRVALLDDAGSINYGPLVFTSDKPCYDFAARDSFVWCATSVEGQPGVIRMDLGTQLGQTLYFAYAYDLYDPTVSDKPTTTCAFMGNTSRLAFASSATPASDGKVYIQSESRVVEEGTLRTGYVRYNTLENKVFKLIQARVDNTNGGFGIDSIDAQDNYYRIGTFAQGENTPEVNVNYPTTAEEYLGFEFTLTRSTSDTSKGPLFTGYQIKALPAVPRQRLIQYPLFCYDHESDKFGVESGYEGLAYDRMSSLEAVENLGDTIRVEDFRTGESFIGLIEEMDFVNKTPSGPRFSGYGGNLIVTIRTV